MKDCDILISLCNGNAGWAKGAGEIGICHAELATGMSLAPAKVRLVALQNVPITKTAEGSRNQRFQEYVKAQSRFRGGPVATEDALKTRVRGALSDALISLAQAGVRDSNKGRFSIGQALDWSRLDFGARREQMLRVLRDVIKQRSGSVDDGDHLIVMLSGTQILVVPNAIPAAISVGPAREMVGQPFLRDHELSAVLKGGRGGPLHIIACHKTATEAQAIKLLGFPDATVVSDSFGIFVADNIQKVQFAFIVNCRDETNTRQRASAALRLAGRNRRGSSGRRTRQGSCPDRARCCQRGECMIHCLKPYSAYKKSGLPWLREVPEHWEVLRGKSLFSCIDVRSSAGNEELLTVSSERGVVPRSSTTVTMFKAESYAGYKLCWPGDLVINSLWAWARGLGVSRYHGIVSSAYGVYRLRPGFEAYSRFIHELVRSGPFNWELQVRSKGIWISRLQLTDEAFLGAPFPLPSPSEQLAIVRFLQYVDRRIRRYVRAKQKMIALLEEQTQALIHRAVSHGLDPNVRLKPSGGEWLGEVPEHWEVKRLKYLSGSIQMGPFGASLTELQSHDTGYKLFGQENTISGDFTKGQRWVTKTQYEGLQRYELLPGDLGPDTERLHRQVQDGSVGCGQRNRGF